MMKNLRAVAMLGDTLFVATHDNKLKHRNVRSVRGVWITAGHANNVSAMTALDGHLYCVTSDNKLWKRRAFAAANAVWKQIGKANNVCALAAHDGFLYCATTQNKLFKRSASGRDVDWTHIARADNIRALVAVGDKLYCTQSNGAVWERSFSEQASWARCGSVFNTILMLNVDGELLFLTSDDPVRKPKYKDVSITLPAASYMRDGAGMFDKCKPDMKSVVKDALVGALGGAQAGRASPAAMVIGAAAGGVFGASVGIVFELSKTADCLQTEHEKQQRQQRDDFKKIDESNYEAEKITTFSRTA